MNYLAHAVLSFHQPEILVGNMISDFVKGKKKFEYPAGIQTGIQLHRDIDSFTDTHEATAIAKQVFRPAYRLYSGALVDVIYDHFLALEEEEFTTASLGDFSKTVYRCLREYKAWLPDRFATMFPYMEEHDWLYNYRSRWGIGKSLGGVVRRSTYLTESDTAFHLFEEHYQLLKDCFRQFWVAVKPFAAYRLEELKNEGPDHP